MVTKPATEVFLPVNRKTKTLRNGERGVVS